MLATGGDVDEAMEWMRYLQKQGYLSEDVDLEPFFASLEEQNLVGGDGQGGLQLTAGGERQIRQSAFEEIFTELSRSGPGYHPVRARPARASSGCPRPGPSSSATTST